MPIRQLIDLPNRNPKPIPWVDVEPNFPWDDPIFSKRMLTEHLDPTHDAASRRPGVMLAQVEWMVNTWFESRDVKNVLDLACGPGLIANALARVGCTVKGIDIAPAAIDYARNLANEWGLTATFIQGDIREIGYGAGFDAAILNYGIPNSVKWEDFAIIMLRIKEALNPGGIVILEFITPLGMQNQVGSKWHTCKDGGLFGDRPYIALKEYFYHKDDRTACEVHYVIDLETTRVREYSICYQGYTNEDLNPLLAACGLKIIAEYDSLKGESNIKNPEMHVIVAERPAE